MAEGFVNLDDVRGQVERTARVYLVPPVYHREVEDVVFLQIKQGHWMAAVRTYYYGDRSPSEPTLWTMAAECKVLNHTHAFLASSHPENKYPPTERPASPVELATFLEECQRYMAEREQKA